MLYIQNFYPGGDAQCMSWAWYLAVDMQLYIIAPLLIIPLVKMPRIGVIINIAAILGTALLTFAISYAKNITANDLAGTFGSPAPAPGSGDFFNDTYIKPWSRAGPFLVVIMTAYIIKVGQSPRTDRFYTNSFTTTEN